MALRTMWPSARRASICACGGGSVVEATQKITTAMFGSWLYCSKKGPLKHLRAGERLGRDQVRAVGQVADDRVGCTR